MYKRILLKLSGEALAPIETPKDKKASVTFDANRVDSAVKDILRLHNMGIQLGIVIGGGNIWRGRFSDTMNPVQADQMGMLATVINALAAQEAITRMGYKATVFTAQEMTRFAELYRADRAIACMEAGEIVLLAGGSGNPFFTTDTAAALRAAELKADVLFKSTTVDGVYDSDPRKNPNAQFLPRITYQQALDMNLHVMDATAFRLCMEQNVPEIRVFNSNDPENMIRVASGEHIGTIITKN